MGIARLGLGRTLLGDSRVVGSHTVVIALAPLWVFCALVCEWVLSGDKHRLAARMAG